MQQTKTKAEKAKKKLTEAKANEEAERVAFCKAEVLILINVLLVKVVMMMMMAIVAMLVMLVVVVQQEVSRKGR